MPDLYFALRALTDPISLLLFLFGIALWTLRKTKRGLSWNGWWCLLLATCLLYALSLSPVAYGLAYMLAKDYPPIEMDQLQDIEVIVILGAGVGGIERDPQLGDASAMRFLYGIEKFKQSGARRLVFSGGRGSGPASNAEVMARLAALFGMPEERIILEPRSRTTWEQAAEVNRLLERKNMRIGIVTSAIHMRRSLETFSRFFSKLVPLPSDYISTPKWGLQSMLPSSAVLSASSAMLHEYLGLLWYGLRGWL
ncbi:YdcF family protein [Nitrospiraceae bacterium AH_259_D15_M11_P09]|nr:YdcF family protein [Nitrospiraceae bacterium AH_259_D15_M11_P09]